MKDYSSEQTKWNPNDNDLDTNPKKRPKYVLNLNLSRILWIISLSCFTLTLSFLFGYWLSSQNQDYLKLQRIPKLPEDALLDQLSENKSKQSKDVNASFKKVEELTERVLKSEALISKTKKALKKKKKKVEYTPKSTKTKQLKTTPKKKEYMIQISAHRKKDNALRLQKALKKQGYAALLNQKQRSNYTLYIVEVGPFKSKDKAMKIRASLIRFKETKGAFITQR